MVDEEELRREREENIKGVPPKDQTMVSAPRCRGFLDKQLAICICCVNFPICEDRSAKPSCWVSTNCHGCVKRL